MNVKDDSWDFQQEQWHRKIFYKPTNCIKQASHFKMLKQLIYLYDKHYLAW